jgi:trigger factor
LKVTTEREENCIVKLTISVEENRETEYLRRSARALSRQYRIRGFRPGKAPYNVIVQRLGIDTVRAQVIEQFGDQVFEEGLEESGLEPVDMASLEEVTWEPFTLHLKVPVGPEVSLGDYRQIRIPWTAPEVTDEELAEELARLQKQQSEWETIERPAELGDQVVLNIVGRVDDDVVLENTDRELVLNAESPYPIPGFAQAVVGMTPGEKKEFALTYPEDHYNAEIAGKEGHFEVTLNSIRVETLPELDDEFAMTVGDYEDLEDLNTKLRASLQERAETTAEREYEEQVWEKMIETATIEYPEVMVDREVEQLKGQLTQQLQQQNMDLDSYFKLTNTTEEAWKEQTRPQAKERLQRSLILSQAIVDEEITIDADEIDAEIEEMTAPLGEQAEQFRELFSSPQGKMSISESLLTRKAMAQLKAIARGEDPPKGSQVAQKEAEEETEEAPEEEAAVEAEKGTKEAPDEEAAEAAEADAKEVRESAIDTTEEAAADEETPEEEAGAAALERVEAAEESTGEAASEPADITEEPLVTDVDTAADETANEGAETEPT